jgi:transposase
MEPKYVGIDLHSTNNYIGIIKEKNKRIYGKKHHNDIDEILAALDVYKDDIIGVVVESTYNWYWLVDGLRENGYPVLLANPAAIIQYDGLKYTDDKWDSFHLAHLLQLGILPVGYIYPKEDRPVRDLLRRRLLFVRQRTAQVLSLQSMITRNTGERISLRQINKLTEADLTTMLPDPVLVLTAMHHISSIKHFYEIVKCIENDVLSRVKMRKEFELLNTIPGVGRILALTIMLEVGDIRRFKKVGNFSSYSRCVNSKCLSNGKKKKENNRKNGNKYLSWAYVEAANFITRFYPDAQKFYQRKMAKTCRIVATKALANKVARASFFIMRDQVEFDGDKLFE